VATRSRAASTSATVKVGESGRRRQRAQGGPPHARTTLEQVAGQVGDRGREVGLRGVGEHGGEPGDLRRPGRRRPDVRRRGDDLGQEHAAILLRVGATPTRHCSVRVISPP
jgi:hypothetical protein